MGKCLMILIADQGFIRETTFPGLVVRHISNQENKGFILSFV